ncbi:DUF6990 domain-containing protein [Paralysiella testudinis]|uniref:Uncharacterized protein n=1 Tax=Paralysiella testudinis TaxID=2809020 RepID=A0A892ZK65_9NEIS|nr:hypothetical protein [Paralysiella testudinis]QRQ82197.1 hypothetical protein JQU52_01830 [Paralysiella testudinis]
MKQNEVFSILESKKWVCSKDEVGDRFCLFTIDEIIVHIIPVLNKRNDYVRISFMPSVSTKEFSKAISFIDGGKQGNYSILSENKIPEKKTEVTLEDIIRLSDDAIIWAKSQDINNELLKLTKLPTNSPGSMPLHHLAALAITGNLTKLEVYSTSFANGERLGFVPYITLEMISRAIFLARNKYSK